MSNNAFRLGKSELGPHAFEERMPSKLALSLEEETDRNRLTDVIPRLASLLQRDRGIKHAYLCNSNAIQIYKLPREGNHFCGYRNIQMLMTSSESIAEIQRAIEKAWDAGINPQSRVETGGIMGTRKHIGTSEAEALFISRNISCKGYRFEGKTASNELLDVIERYFTATSPDEAVDRVVQTQLAPIFLQRPKHSLTVIGFERTRGGKRRLLVFDPAYQPPASLRCPLSFRSRFESARVVLWQYRRDEMYLKRYREFEIVTVEQPAQPQGPT